MDVTDAEGVERAVALAFEKRPDINVGLGNAGGTGVFPFEIMDRETFDRIVAFNFLGQTYFARAVLREWRKRNCAGHLIFTSSYCSRIPMAGISADTASKAALEMFARNLALEGEKEIIEAPASTRLGNGGGAAATCPHVGPVRAAELRG